MMRYTSDNSASEAGTNPGNYRISRSGNTTSSLIVEFQMSGSATNGTDYFTIDSPKTIPAGESHLNIQVGPVDDTVDDDDESVILTLSDSTAYDVGSDDSATVIIQDNDPPAPAGTVQFSPGSYTVAEGGASATITVTRTNGSNGAASVSYSTSNGSAQAPADYTTRAGTLNWAHGDATIRTFTVPIVSDASDESDETVNLALSSASGASLGTPGTAVLTIVDDDSALVDGAMLVDQSITPSGPLAPGQSFTKTWRLRNTGSTTWANGTNGYTLNFVPNSGERMRESSYVFLSNSVPVGGEYVFSVQMTAPLVPDNYVGHWRMNNASSEFFGDTCTVQVVVEEEADPQIEVAPSERNFGDITVGEESTLSFTVRNVGGGVLHTSASGLSGPFSFVGSRDYDIAAGFSATVQIRFRPTDEGPISRTITFSGGTTTIRQVRGTGVSDEPAVGSLRITINPSAARDNGAQWRVDEGPWRSSGTTVENVSTGTHVVSFNEIDGWSSPSSRSVNVARASVTHIVEEYSRLQVPPTIPPDARNDYPSPWRNADCENFVSSETDPWEFFARQCTSFVAWRMNRDAGVTETDLDPDDYPFANYMGGRLTWENRLSDAHRWETILHGLGFSVNHTPAIGAIAHWNINSTSQFGHVAYVRAVNGDGTIDIEDYNWDSCGYRHETISADTVDNFIHFRADGSGGGCPQPLIWYRDADADGSGNPEVSQQACEKPSGYVANPADCNDGDDEAYGGASELCDSKDNNCDGEIDEEAPVWYRDSDADGFGDAEVERRACEKPDGFVDNADDPDDDDPRDPLGVLFEPRSMDFGTVGISGHVSPTELLIFSRNGDFNFAIDPESIPDWLTVSPREGSSRDGEARLSVRFNRGLGLEPGSNQTQLKVRINDRFDIKLPVTVDVQGEDTGAVGGGLCAGASLAMVSLTAAGLLIARRRAKR